MTTSERSTSERSTSERSTVLGAFRDRDRADKAIDDLRQIGFSYNQIRLAERGAGSFLDSFKSLFTGQETTSANTPDDLMKLGVPEQDAHYYQSQLDAGRAIVIVNATGRIEEALTTLHQSGAYDISARLRTAEASVPGETPQPTAGTPPPTAGTPPPTAGTSQPAAGTPPPTAGTSQPTAGSPGPYNPNAPQGANNPNVPPEPPRVPPGTPRQG